MVGQATMNGRQTGTRQVTRNVSELAHDVITLAELQAQLLACDLRDGKSRAIGPIVSMAAGLILALGTMPVLLMGIGWLLVNHAGWSEGAALLVAGGGGLVVSGGLAWFGWRRLKAALAIIARSRNELAENIRWLKGTLKRGEARHESQFGR